MSNVKRTLCELCGERAAGRDGFCGVCRDDCDQEPPDQYNRNEDARLDDPRHGQAASINRERYTPERSD